MIIAVDFDATLYIGKNMFPYIGTIPNTDLINNLKKRRANGDKLILWTCRHGKTLDAAVNWCAERGLYFDAVNDDIPEIIEQWGNDRGKKVTADLYIDDAAINVEAYMKKIRK